MKKLALLALCMIFSMFFFVSCGSDDEDGVDTETGDTVSDADTTDSDSDTTDTANPTDDPTNPTDDPTNPTDNPTDEPTNPTDNQTDPTDNPTEEPTNPTDEPTNPTDDPTNPTDPTEPTNPGEGSDGNLNTGDTSGNQAATGATGAACNSDSQCNATYSGSFGGEDFDQEAFCLTANDNYFPAPGGYCTLSCDTYDQGACNSVNGVCYLYSTYNGYCFHKCTKPSDCRVGYRCSTKIHACMPDCATAGCKTGVCDETDNVCVKEN